MNIFFELHKDIPREGPGHPDATRQASSLLPLSQEAPLQILDIGCGPGAQTLVLATQFPYSRITAVDKHEPFLTELTKRAAGEGLSERVQAIPGDMKMLDEQFPSESFDLIWSEGAIYIMGFANGLTKWRPLLKKGGYLVVSELSWLTDTPAPEAHDFWITNYPAIQTVAQNTQTIRDCGYELLDHFVLPEAGWWNDYYTPLETRVAQLRDKYNDDDQARSVLDETQQEIDLYRHHSKDYGYVFYLMRNS